MQWKYCSDEEIVRITAGRMLQQAGHTVDFAKDGAQAIEMYTMSRESGKPYDAVIMDLTVPGGMGGKDCVRELARRYPTVKALVSSGYSNDPVVANFRESGFCGVLTKPYGICELNEALRVATGD